MKKNHFILFFLMLSTFVFSQERREPPIPVEVLFGNQRTALTLSINKSIEGKFRYQNITSTAAYYDYNEATRNVGRTELVMVNSLVYQFQKHIGVSAGMQYHFMKGFIPNVAVHFSYADPTWLLVLTPYYNFLPWSNMETVGIVEYKPSLTNNLRLFTRVQGFYGHNFKAGAWERGMAYFRLGLTMKKYTLGFGSNFDYYNRPVNSEIQNFGGFFRVDI